ncbi:MAG: hypothetical protein IJ779_05890 [Ruminococcus sp.]|nr:hypothetical protein [Ruminococcus sp.]
MPEKKPSLEEILEEYSPESSNVSVGRVDAQKILNSTVQSPDLSKMAASTKKVSGMISQDKKVTMVDADAMEEIKNIPHGKPLKPLDQPVQHSAPADAPQIRRMSDSTRAKEAESSKRKKKKRWGKTPDHTYDRETPDGEYMYTPPSFKKKKKTRAAILAEFESPEEKKQITDIGPSPTAIITTGIDPKKPLGAYTDEELSEIAKAQTQQIPVDIDVNDEAEFAAAKTRKRRTKRIVDFNYYGDVEDVGRDIYELRSIISSRVFILATTAFMSLYITICNQFGFPIASILTAGNVRLYLAVHLILGLIAMISSLPVMSNGLKKLFTLKADSDSMAAMTCVTCVLAMIPAFISPRLMGTENIHIYMPVAILSLFFNALGKHLIMKRAARNFKFVSRNFDRHGVTYVMDEERAERITRGTLGDFPILASMRKTDFLTDFLRYTYSSDMTDHYCKHAAPIILLVSFAISMFLIYFCKGTYASLDAWAFGLSVFSMIVASASCVSLPLVCNLPLENMSKNALQNKGIMLGYQSVDDFYDTNSVLVDASSLFPKGTVRLDGIRVFSNTKPDEALLEAASLTQHGGSIMSQLFDDVTTEGERPLYRIENYSYEENMGMCGWISNKRILFGSRELMISHNIEGLPTKTKEDELSRGGKEILYLSISGNLAAMFIVEIVADRYVKRWAKRLCKNKICIFVKSVDPCITTRKLYHLFDIPESMSRILPQRLHDDFNEETKKSVRLSASMATTGRFASLAELIIGTKIVHFSAIIGLILQTASILLAFALSMALIMSKAFQSSSYIYLTATSITVYNLLWTLITIIAVKFKKA